MPDKIRKLEFSSNFVNMAGVAQLVRVPDCDSGCRGFESRHSPHFLFGFVCYIEI